MLMRSTVQTVDVRAEFFIRHSSQQSVYTHALYN
jgi:hypothetical protein